jgi:hypothetical protein
VTPVGILCELHGQKTFAKNFHPTFKVLLQFYIHYLAMKEEWLYALEWWLGSVEIKVQYF